jgi:hypothetical protein
LAAEQGGADNIAAAIAVLSRVSGFGDGDHDDDGDDVAWETDLDSIAGHVAEVADGPSAEDLDRAGLGDLRNR